jgi:hypothetical protein
MRARKASRCNLFFGRILDCKGVSSNPQTWQEDGYNPNLIIAPANEKSTRLMLAFPETSEKKRNAISDSWKRRTNGRYTFHVSIKNHDGLKLFSASNA